jgi:hypothetical protein
MPTKICERQLSFVGYALGIVAAHELRFAVHQLDRIPSTAPLRASKRLRPPSSFRQRSPACSEAIRLPHSGYEHLAVSEGIEAR